MQTPLSIEEQQRLTDGHKALLSAIDRLIRADNDKKLHPHSENMKTAYRNAFNNLKSIANNEKKHLITLQKELF